MAAGGQPGGSQTADGGSIDEATFSRGFPVGAGTRGAARSIKAADGGEFLTVAMSDGTYARAEQIHPGNDNSLRLSQESQDLVRDDIPCPGRHA